MKKISKELSVSFMKTMKIAMKTWRGSTDLTGPNLQIFSILDLILGFFVFINEI